MSLAIGRIGLRSSLGSRRELTNGRWVLDAVDGHDDLPIIGRRWLQRYVFDRRFDKGFTFSSDKHTAGCHTFDVAPCELTVGRDFDSAIAWVEDGFVFEAFLGSYTLGRGGGDILSLVEIEGIFVECEWGITDACEPL